MGGWVRLGVGWFLGGRERGGRMGMGMGNGG